MLRKGNGSLNKLDNFSNKKANTKLFIAWFWMHFFLIPKLIFLTFYFRCFYYLYPTYIWLMPSMKYTHGILIFYNEFDFVRLKVQFIFLFLKFETLIFGTNIWEHLYSYFPLLIKSVNKILLLSSKYVQSLSYSW